MNGYIIATETVTKISTNHNDNHTLLLIIVVMHYISSYIYYGKIILTISDNIDNIIM